MEIGIEGSFIKCGKRHPNVITILSSQWAQSLITIISGLLFYFRI